MSALIKFSMWRPGNENGLTSPLIQLFSVIRLHGKCTWKTSVIARIHLNLLSHLLAFLKDLTTFPDVVGEERECFVCWLPLNNTHAAWFTFRLIIQLAKQHFCSAICILLSVRQVTRHCLFLLTSQTNILIINSITSMKERLCILPTLLVLRVFHAEANSTTAIHTYNMWSVDNL